MSIKIKNLRISPYSQKDDLKVIFGDQMTVTFEIEHVAGESYACALDNERILYPPNRPICAYTEAFSRDGDDVTFTLDLRTSKLRDFVSSIRKPMPIWLQVVRGVGGKYETVLLDDVLALPSVIDGSMTVYDGDPIKSLIDAKMDKPQAEGTDGQVLTMDADGHYAWQDLPEIPEQEQADWTETDDTKKSFILHKPELANVATTGSYNDLTDKPELFSGDYNDLTNKPTIPTKTSDLTNDSDFQNGTQVSTAISTAIAGKADKSELPTKTSDLTNDSDFQTGTEVSTAISTAIANKADKSTTLAGYGITNAYTKTEVDSKVASVFHYKGSVQTYADLPSTGQEVGDVWNVVTADATHGIKAGDNVAWTGSGWDVLAGEIDLSAYATKAELSTVATTGDYDDLSNKPDLSLKLDAPTVAGTVGQVLTKTATGQEWADTVAEEAPDYLCFEALEANSSVALNKVNTPFNPITLETSADGENWTAYTWSGNAGAVITLANIGDKVYWRGDNSVPLSYWYNSAASWHQFVTTGKLACSGTVMSLFDKTCKLDEIPTDDEHGGTGLVSLFKDAGIVTPPKLTATKLHNDSYNDMFDGSAIVTAPELPAITVFRNTYGYMFKNCANLVAAPKLPATTIGEGCYKFMFQNCVRLATAPDLPATTLANLCYQSTFEGCTSLVNAPARLPAMTLAENCYSGMFKNCQNLSKPPALPATTLAAYCYSDMFKNCGLTEVPALPAVDLAYSCYGGMFSGNTKLENIPLNYLPATTLQTYCYQWMFAGCSSLKCGTRLPATVMADYCYSHLYENCTSLTDSERISVETLANGCMYQMLKNCTNLCRVWIPSLTSWNDSAMYQWMSGLSYLRRAFVCNANLDTSTRSESKIPENWIPTRSAYTADGLIPKWNINTTNVTFAPTDSEQDWIYVNGELTLNAIQLPSGYVGSAQAFIIWPSYVADSYTVIAGTGITFIDTPRKGYMSRVLVTWEAYGNATLHVMWETAI